MGLAHGRRWRNGGLRLRAAGGLRKFVQEYPGQHQRFERRRIDGNVGRDQHHISGNDGRLTGIDRVSGGVNRHNRVSDWHELQRRCGKAGRNVDHGVSAVGR